MSSDIEFLSAVLLVSRDAKRLAEFYRDGLGFPLEEEVHGETEIHYGCELGDVHFAIHPRENFDGNEELRAGNVNLAFAVFDVAAVVARLASKGINVLYPPEDSGFAIMTALRDPDGNYLELTQLSDRWFEHLETRRTKGQDVISKWRVRKGG